MNGLSRLKRHALQTMAGRRPQLMAAAATALVLLVILACIGRLLELPSPPRSPDVKSPGLFDFALQVERLQQTAQWWSATPTMKALGQAFLAIDTLLFIPAYAGLLTGLRARWDHRVPQPVHQALRWRRWRVLLAIAVGSDLIENLLTWLAVQQGMVFATAWLLASWVKWASVALMLLAVLGVALAKCLPMPWPDWKHRGRRVLEVLRDSARYVWLYAIPLFMVFGGLAMLVGVPQTREIIADLGDAQAGAASRLTTLTITGFMLVVWIAACGFAFALVGKVDPLVPREGPGIDEDQTAILLRAHQLIVGLAALVATTAVLLRMSSTPGTGLSLFIVAGCIGWWVVASLACNTGFAVAGLPRHQRAQPVSWRSVAVLLTLYVLLVGAWRFLPDPDESALREWGLYRRPDALWRFNAGLIDTAALQFSAVALFVGALFIGALVLARRRTSGGRALAVLCFLCGLCVWLWTALQTLGFELLAAQVLTIFFASCALWLLTHRVPLADYQAWQDRLFKPGPDESRQLKMLKGVLDKAMRLSFGTVSGNVVKLVLMIVGVFFVLPHSGDSALMAETGTLAVVLAALSIWGLLATWLLVYLPMRHGLGNWTLAPLLWLLAIGLLPDADERVDRLDNPAVLAAARVGTEALPNAPTGNTQAPTLHQHFAAWRQLLPDPQRSPVFVVAGAGGGLRAAYWTAVLLAEMDDRTCGQFGRHVLAASGVSGGSLGLALYAAQRRVWQEKPLPERCVPERAAQMRRVLSGDFLAPIAAGLLFADAPMAFLPFVSLQRDRTDALSSAIERRWMREFDNQPAAAGLLSLPMRQALPSLFETTPALGDQSRRAHPVLYLNATAVETGRRVIASNVTLGNIPADPFFYDENISRGTRLLSARTSLLDAALNSARFPVISPAGKLLACSTHGSIDAAGVCSREPGPYGLLPWGHLLDGGYFENSGLETLGDALQALRQPGPASVHGELPPVYLIAISNDLGTKALCPGAPTPRRGPTQPQDNLLPEASPTFRSGDAVDGPRSTLQALLSVREGRARLELERAVRRFGCANVLEWSLGETLRPQRGSEEPALGWMLSASSMRRMDDSVRHYANAFPFDLASCPPVAGPPPRGWIGEKIDAHARCAR